MKIGDLVKLKNMHRRQPVRVGVVIELIGKKCWRTQELGTPVNWDLIDPEPHAIIAINNDTLTIPTVDLEVVSRGTELDDEQLEFVVGGMSPQGFSDWRAEKINEGR